MLYLQCYKLNQWIPVIICFLMMLYNTNLLVNKFRCFIRASLVPGKRQIRNTLKQPF